MMNCLGYPVILAPGASSPTAWIRRKTEAPIQIDILCILSVSLMSYKQVPGS